MGLRNCLKAYTLPSPFRPMAHLNSIWKLVKGRYNQEFPSFLNISSNGKKPIVIAFDEFQEAAAYPGKAKALLRTYIQQMRNVTFVFSGSSNYFLQNVFYSSKQPFIKVPGAW